MEQIKVLIIATITQVNRFRQNGKMLAQCTIAIGLCTLRLLLEVFLWILVFGIAVLSVFAIEVFFNYLK